MLPHMHCYAEPDNNMHDLYLNVMPVQDLNAFNVIYGLVWW